MSKSLATIATQPLIVAKVGLQSRPPPAREGKPFKTFSEVIRYILEHEGPLSLFKGIGPQITKGLLVQGILMMTKERYVSLVGFRNTYLRRNRTELLFIVLFRSFRKLRDEKLAKLAAAAAEKAKAASPVLLK
jgi:hypothetical protein